MKNSVQKLAETLKNKGLRITPQRLEMLAIYSWKGIHPTANEAWARLKEKFPSVSRATAYNILDTFAQKGIIVLLNTPKGMRFDFNIKLHAHFICRLCGEIDDVEIDDKNLPRLNFGNKKVEDIQIYFYGLCEKCQKGAKL